jgi:hypothetical protein
MQGVELMLQIFEFPLRAARPFPGVNQPARQPLDLLRSGARRGPQRLNLTGEPSQPLAPIGDGAHRGEVRPLRVADGLLQLDAPVHGVRQRCPGFLDDRVQLRLRSLDGLGLALQLVGIPTGSVCFDRCG